MTTSGLFSTLIASLLLFTHLAGATCEKALVQTQLGIGVLGVDWGGRRVLAVAPFIGSAHERLVNHLIDHHGVIELRWLGELSYKNGGVKDLVIFEANESSGLFSREREKLTLLASNHVSELPSRWRATSFVGYGGTDRFRRLERSLEFFPGDIRHSLLNALMNLEAAVGALNGSRRTTVQRLEARRLILESKRPLIYLVQWLVNRLVAENRMTLQEAEEICLAVKVLTNPNFTLVQASRIDRVKLRGEIDRLAELVAPASGVPDLKIYYE